MLHYMPGLYDIPGAADARQAFNGAGYPGLGGMEPGGLPGLCIRPGPPGCGVYTKTTCMLIWGSNTRPAYDWYSRVVRARVSGQTRRSAPSWARGPT